MVKCRNCVYYNTNQNKCKISDDVGKIDPEKEHNCVAFNRRYGKISKKKEEIDIEGDFSQI